MYFYFTCSFIIWWFLSISDIFTQLPFYLHRLHYDTNLKWIKLRMPLATYDMLSLQDHLMSLSVMRNSSYITENTCMHYSKSSCNADTSDIWWCYWRRYPDWSSVLLCTADNFYSNKYIWCNYNMKNKTDKTRYVVILKHFSFNTSLLY